MTDALATFSLILVPLDGSELAERALLPAERIARATRSRLLLVRIVPETRWTSASSGYLLAPHVYNDILTSEEEGARAYLQRVATALRGQGMAVDTVVRRGDPASLLIAVEQEHQAGLIVLATHGHTGLKRLALGSVADRVVRAARAPVLLIRPFGDDPRVARLERVLVPLDGSALSELALDVTRKLAGSVVHHVLLAWVVDPEHVAGESEEAQRYLDETRNRLAEFFAQRDCTLDTVVLYGQPTEQILERATDQDIVIMGTHGRSGITRWALGSVADHVLHQTHTPLLLVRNPDTSEQTPLDLGHVQRNEDIPEGTHEGREGVKQVYGNVRR